MNIRTPISYLKRFRDIKKQPAMPEDNSNDAPMKVRDDGTVVFDAPVELKGGLRVMGPTIKVQERIHEHVDNLVSLNCEDGPYCGIEARTGEGESQYLVYVKKQKDWFLVDPETKNRRKLVTSHPATTNTHNFWIANKVQPTAGSNTEILPEFVAALPHENKRVVAVHARASKGKVPVAVKVNGKVVEDSKFVAGQNPRSTNDLDVPLSDGDMLSIEVYESDFPVQARNLSVSIVVRTDFE